MNLDDQISNFLASADAKAARSKLEPYAELIRQLRQRRWTYDQITQTLQVKFGISVHRTTVHAFVKVRAGKGRSALVMPAPDFPGLQNGTTVATKRPRFKLDP